MGDLTSIGDVTNEKLDIDEPATKKRKVTKVLDKNFHCQHEGCDRAYSRAEHLYRHQLNHAPKHIYRCDQPDCGKTFVRQDLCVRHKERHTNKKPTSHRKAKSMTGHNVDDNAADNQSGGFASSTETSDGPPIRHDSTTDCAMPSSDRMPDEAGGFDRRTSQISAGQHSAVDSTSSLGPHLQVTPKLPTYEELPETIKRERMSLDTTSMTSSCRIYPAVPQPMPPLAGSRRDFRSNSDLTPMHHAPPYGNGEQYHPSPYPTFGYTGLEANGQPLPINAYPQLYPDQQHAHSAGSPEANAHNTPAMQPVNALPLYPQQNTLSRPNGNGIIEDGPMVTPASQALMDMKYMPVYNHQVSYAQACSMPIFNHETALHTPFGSADDFASWLLLENEGGLVSQPGMVSHETSIPIMGVHPEMSAPISSTSYNDARIPRYVPPAESMPVSPKPLDVRISVEHRRRIITYIKDEFRDSRRQAITQQRNRVLAGDHDQCPHMLSPQMLEASLLSYWTHVDPQYPIMHRATFDTDAVPDLLLMTLIALGASCLDASYSNEIRHMASDLAYFLAWHIRYKLYQHADFGPPAKLWVFQALLLLEVFEKMYSTRELHERAHVHHATTMALMRRGSSLVGVTETPFTLDRPHEMRDFVGSVNMSGYNTTDGDFNKWISAEAMRRVAFAAFNLDTIHANMFGHSAAMLPHEMRIRLPCDEYTWTANSYAEVQRMQEMLQAQGHVELTFDEALKRTLNGRSVHTNRFGRVSIMAGLLSVCWHLKLQDIRVSSVGVGKKGSWAPKVLQAVDFWKQDFVPTSIAARGSSFDGNKADGPGLDNVIESPMVLHHLAHMTMQCDVLDYQIYAGATVALGRFITVEDRQTATRKVRDIWAPSAFAQDATFHALRFLSETLLGEQRADKLETSSGQTLELAYHPRDDVMLSRPWVLYIAVLVVWSYGYALDGVIPPPVYDLSTQQSRLQDLRGYLQRVGGVSRPEDLSQITNRNRCLGLLMVVRDMLRGTRWELLHDAAASLKDCIILLMPGIKID